MPFPVSPEIEIINGTTKTNAEGKFTVKFKAIPDGQMAKKDNPVFDYLIYADITDINGETQSNEANVSA